MNIAILGTRGIPSKYGGFETFAEQLAVRLVKRDIDVTVFCEARERTQQKIFKGVNLIHVPAPNFSSLSTILFDLRCLWRARKDFDVVYMLGYGASLFCFIPRLWGALVWINMDGVEWARAKWSCWGKVWFKIMETLAMFTCNRIIADSDGIRRHLIERHSHIPTCTVIPYGAQLIKNIPDPIVLKKWGLSKWKYYIVVCRFEPENHVLEILEGFLASKSRYPIVLVGDHQMGNNYMQNLLSIQDPRVYFIGSIYNQTMLQILRFSAFAYFHGHSVGGTNPSLLEAMGCGNVTIAHDNLFNREVADDSALYFSQTEDIPHLVELLESSPTKHEYMKKRAHQIIEEKYTWEIVARKYEEMLNCCVNVSMRSA